MIWRSEAVAHPDVVEILRVAVEHVGEALAFGSVVIRSVSTGGDPSSVCTGVREVEVVEVAKNDNRSIVVDREDRVDECTDDLPAGCASAPRYGSKEKPGQSYSASASARS